MTIYLKSKELRGPVDLRVQVWENGGHLFVYLNTSLLLSLSGNVAELSQVLRSAAEQLEAQTYTTTERGIMSGELTPIRAGLVQIGDITEDLPVATRWALLVRRFQDSPGLADVVEMMKAEYKKHAGHDYNERIWEGEAGAPVTDQVQQDLAAVRSIAGELLSNGLLVYGHQSRIARALGIANAGGYRRRITAVAEALQREAKREERAA